MGRQGLMDDTGYNFFDVSNCLNFENCRKDAYKDAIEEIKHQMISLHTDMILRYGADIIEAKCDAFDELKKWLEEQK